MFSLEYLHVLRAAELELIAAYLKPETRILELGAGTGAQALALAQRGFDVSAVDVPQSNYSKDRVFDVTDYDGRHLPFPDRTFDIVFSSNVLEHIADLGPLHREIRRVLKPNGCCIHVLPSTAWRFWTSISAFPEMVRTIKGLIPRLLQRREGGRTESQRLASAWMRAARELLRPLVPVRHGAT
ncbi:MAG: class I SAM-dependent methyltransferase, partial [Acidimicrobiia bacterium]